MPVTIPDEISKSAHFNESELKVELAVAHFQRDRLTLGQAAQTRRTASIGRFNAFLAAVGFLSTTDRSSWSRPEPGPKT